MTTLRTFHLPILVGLALSFGSAARADIDYNNLGAASDGVNSIVVYGPLADSFSTGAAGSLTDVQLLLSTSGDTGTISVDLLSDNMTSPGSEIANFGTISDTSLSSSPTIVDVSGFTPVTLAADTRYWIQLSSSDSSASWSYAYDTTGPGVAGEYNDFQGQVYPNFDGPYQMQVTVTGIAAPEPSTLFLPILAVLNLFIYNRRIF